MWRLLSFFFFSIAIIKTRHYQEGSGKRMGLYKEPDHISLPHFTSGQNQPFEIPLCGSD